MIAIIQQRATKADKAEEYFDYLIETGVRDYRAVVGNAAFTFCAAL